MNAFALSGLLVGITNLIMGIFVYSKNPKNLVNRIWLPLTFSVAIWGFGAYKIGLIKDANLALFWWRLTHTGVIFIPVFFLHFVYVFLKKKEKWPVRLSYVMGILFLCLNFTSLFSKKVELVFNSFYYDGRPPTVVFTIFVVLWLYAEIFAHYQLFVGFRKELGVRREQIKYFFLATIVGYGGGTTSFLPVFGFNIYPLGNFTICLYPLIMSYAILKYRLMDIRVAFTRVSIFLIVYTVVLGLPFIVLYHTGSGILATSLAVIFASAGQLIYRFLEKKAETIVLARQRNYQGILLQAATTMVTEHNLLKLSRLIVYILKKAINLKFTAIFVKNTRSKVYPLMAMRGAIDLQARNTILNGEDSFINYLDKNREPFFSEEMPPKVRNSLRLPLEIRIVIPAFAGDELLAVVLLGDKVNLEPYTQEDINVFKIISRQATLAIQNCVFFEESKDLQERMFAAEKLASIGGMADGLAHQIKNRLNQFSLAGGELKLEIEEFVAKHDKLVSSDPELDKTFKYLKEISVSLLDNVKRTDGVIKGILDFAKVEKKENFFGLFSLKEVAELSTNLLIVKHEAAVIPLSVKIDTDDTIFGVKSQLTEVIYNLLDNAYEATKEKEMQLKDEKSQDFTPAIELCLIHANGHNEIRISDNGIGIKEQDKHRIFAPFFTTKTSYKSGSGIGVYVVKRIVEENHKGKIRFTSKYMQGTEFVIELPKN